jgi:hypothetical protein
MLGGNIASAQGPWMDWMKIGSELRMTALVNPKPEEPERPRNPNDDVSLAQDVPRRLPIPEKRRPYRQGRGKGLSSQGVGLISSKPVRLS